VIKNKKTIGGLCSGVGGIELGFRNAGFDISWANDMDRYAMVTYSSIIGSNHYIGKEPMKISDIEQNHKNEVSYVNVLGAGFPCQAFSVAGRRKGFQDARGTVIWDIIHFLDEVIPKDDGKGPDVLFLENVKNFKTHNDGNTYSRIEEELYKRKYSVYTKILNTADYSNVPQNRERTFMVCFRDEPKWNNFRFHEREPDLKHIKKAENDCPKTYAFHKNFPKKLKSLQSIDQILEDVNDDRYWYDSKSKYVKMLNELYKEMRSENAGSQETLYQIRRVYPRANKSKLCPTLTANMGTGGHNVPMIPFGKGENIRWRKLTPSECFKFQGYKKFILPENLSNGQLYKQAGNSVSVPVITKLAKSILKSLEI
jgi:DNA (cytosine-5)-methyltransferase 1